MERSYRIGLSLYLDSTLGRGCLEGISAYCHKARMNWLFDISSNVNEETIKKAIGQCDAIVVQLDKQELVDVLASSGRPCVNVACTPGDILPTVRFDAALAGRLGAEYFLRRGFRTFAFCGSRFGGEAQLVQEGFADRVREAGRECIAACTKQWVGDCAAVMEWTAIRTGTTRWIRHLPRPAALMASKDSVGQLVLETCHDLVIDVPDEIAVLGVGDELLCRSCTPCLSSISLDGPRIGYEAAALLSRLLAGQRPSVGPILIPPSQVVSRQSTNRLSVTDPSLAQALRFIQEHACDPIQVADVASQLGTCRRHLERQFRSVLNLSLHEVIREVQIDRAKQVLRDTGLSIREVARTAGFADTCWFTTVFRKCTGVTPGGYRKSTTPG